MTTFPDQLYKIWGQVSDRDNYVLQKIGNLFSTIGIDLSSNLGRIRLGVRMLLGTSQKDLADITGVPVAFEVCGTGIYTIAGASNVGYALVSDTTTGLLGSPFVRSTGGSAPTTIDSTLSDMIFGNNKLYVSTIIANGLNICNKVGNNNWGTPIVVEADTVGYPHMLFPFAGRVYFTNNLSKILSMDSAESVATSGVNTVILNGITNDQSNVITRPFVSANKVWIPCINTVGGLGHVYEWDGSTTTTQVKHDLHTSGILSGCNYHDVPYLMDVEANLLMWNGGTFKVQASFYRKSKKLLYNPISTVNNRWMHPNGMKVVDDKIRMVVDSRNNDNAYSIEDSIPAGIYEFDPKHPELGIYNISLFGLSKLTDSLSDFGQLRIAGAGGLGCLNIASTLINRDGMMMAGACVYTDATNTQNGIYYDDLNDTIQKAGSFVTLKVDSSGLKDINNYIKVIHSKMKYSTDRIVLKARTYDEDSVEATIFWLSANSFTVPNSSIDLTGYWNVGDARGGEVEVTQGVGSNQCSHITSAVLDQTTGLWTVTVEDNFNGWVKYTTSKARFQKWIWLGESNYSEGKTHMTKKPDSISSWIQAKVWMTLIGKSEVERLLTNEEVLLPADLDS